MPRRNDLSKILIIGSGPIVIGQGCEFDYAGTQGAKALVALGYDVALVNSNPATIMTDPEVCGRTYVEPLELETVRAIVRREKPDALLPTLGGQTALNLAIALHDDGTLAELGVELIGARAEAIRRAEDRALFKEALEKVGLSCPRSEVAKSVEDARRIAGTLGYPLVLRPSFTLGGTGGGIVRTPSELDAKVAFAIASSPAGEVLVEESLIGWKEFEHEVVRDAADNFITVCTMENIDPMGIHTGDSIIVAPADDPDRSRIPAPPRRCAIQSMRPLGVERAARTSSSRSTRGPDAYRVIEINARVSRSSALACKATGYPIAKVAAKLALGFTLDELTNAITRRPPPSSLPSTTWS